MFTMMLCDENVASTIKAVCFYEDRYDEFEVSSTYVLEYFKIKKMGATVEIHIEPTTKITKALTQFNIERHQFNLAVRGETGDAPYVNITVKVIHVAEIEKVGADQIQKREIQIADESANSSLVLWRDSCETFSFEPGDVISVENATTSNFNNVVHLTMSPYTSIEKVQQDLNVVSAKVIEQTPPAITSVDTKITAIRGFKCHLKCIDCKLDIDVSEYTNVTTDSILTCPFCKTSFLAESSPLRNECDLLLTINKEWVTATSKVSVILKG